MLRPKEVAQQPAQLPGGSMCQQVGSFSLEDVFSHRLAMLKTCPHFMRGRLRECFEISLMERYGAKMESDELREIRAWELFGLVPIILLHRPRGTGAVGRSGLAHRAEEFARALREEALRNTPAHSRGRPERSDAEESERRGKAAQARVQRRQVSRARQELTGAALAPKNEATSRELRARRPQEQLREIPPKRSWSSCRQPKSV